MSIYDKTKMMCRTWIEAINNLFNMGKELEESVDGMKGGIVKDVTLTEVDKHYTLTILYDDGTSDTVNWDDSTVGIEDITMTYQDGVYILTITLTDGTRYTFSIPVGNVVTEEELTALNLGTPDDTASSTGSLWARVKYAITTLGDKANTSDVNTALALKADKSDTYTKSEVYTKTEVNTLDSQNVKKTGTNIVTGDIQVPTPSGNTSVVNKEYVDNKRIVKYLDDSNWFSILANDTFKEGDEYNVVELALSNCVVIAQSKYYDENEQQKRFNAVGFVVINNVYYPLRLITVVLSGSLRLDYVDNGVLNVINADLTTSQSYRGSVVHY